MAPCFYAYQSVNNIIKGKKGGWLVYTTTHNLSLIMTFNVQKHHFNTIFFHKSPYRGNGLHRLPHPRSVDSLPRSCFLPLVRYLGCVVLLLIFTFLKAPIMMKEHTESVQVSKIPLN